MNDSRCPLCELKCGKCGFFKKKWGRDQKSCEERGASFDDSPVEVKCDEFDSIHMPAQLDAAMTAVKNLTLEEVQILNYHLTDIIFQRECEKLHGYKLGQEVSHKDKHDVVYRGKIVKFTEDSITFLTSKGEKFTLIPESVHRAE